MENPKQPQRRDMMVNKKPAASKATLTGDSGEKSSTNLRASKGNRNTIGVRSKTLDLSKSSQTKTLKAKTSGNFLNRPITKNKASTKSGFELDRTSKIKDTVSQLKTTSTEKDFQKVLLASPDKSAHSGITFKPKKSVSPTTNIFLSPQDVTSSSPTSKQSPKGSKSSEIFKPSPIKNETVVSHISEKNRTHQAPSLIPVKKTQERREQKRKSVKLESLKPNIILSATSTNPDTKPNERNLKKDSDTKVGTTSSAERDLEALLLDSPSVKSSAHSGIIFMPKKKATSPGKNIFILPKDGSLNEDRSSNSLHQPSLENQPPKPARKTLQFPSKDATNEAVEKTRSGKQLVAPTKKTATAGTDKTTSSKMLRSKTEVTISTNPKPSKSLHKVQSFSRLKPQPLIAKKPAHQAILDVTTLVKGDPKIALPPLTSAHSGVPFKPKKPSTFAAVNIFAQLKEDTSK